MTEFTGVRTRASARPRAVAALAAVIAVVALTLAPRSIVAPARSLFMRATDLAVGPLLQQLSTLEVERTLNAILFVPLGLAVALLLGRRAWLLAIPFGLAVSAAVEFAQERIPGRVPDPQDVFANTAGAALGALLVGAFFAIRAIWRRVRRGRRRAPGGRR
ncbi:VanZ family protein [Microbacterium sp. AZCO]|uniref:VanZ family protein n=1 Tax=Microbacterium sp. AZCO TaxID=3142976 RepID=UPI0031F3F2E9